MPQKRSSHGKLAATAAAIILLLSGTGLHLRQNARDSAAQQQPTPIPYWQRNAYMQGQLRDPLQCSTPWMGYPLREYDQAQVKQDIFEDVSYAEAVVQNAITLFIQRGEVSRVTAFRSTAAHLQKYLGIQPPPPAYLQQLAIPPPTPTPAVPPYLKPPGSEDWSAIYVSRNIMERLLNWDQTARDNGESPLLTDNERKQMREVSSRLYSYGIQLYLATYGEYLQEAGQMLQHPELSSYLQGMGAKIENMLHVLQYLADGNSYTLELVDQYRSGAAALSQMASEANRVVNRSKDISPDFQVVLDIAAGRAGFPHPFPFPDPTRLQRAFREISIASSRLSSVRALPYFYNNSTELQRVEELLESSPHEDDHELAAAIHLLRLNLLSGKRSDTSSLGALSYYSYYYSYSNFGEAELQASLCGHSPLLMLEDDDGTVHAIDTVSLQHILLDAALDSLTQLNDETPEETRDGRYTNARSSVTSQRNSSFNSRASSFLSLINSTLYTVRRETGSQAAYDFYTRINSVLYTSYYGRGGDDYYTYALDVTKVTVLMQAIVAGELRLEADAEAVFWRDFQNRWAQRYGEQYLPEHMPLPQFQKVFRRFAEEMLEQSPGHYRPIADWQQLMIDKHQENISRGAG